MITETDELIKGAAREAVRVVSCDENSSLDKCVDYRADGDCNCTLYAKFALTTVAPLDDLAWVKENRAVVAALRAGTWQAVPKEPTNNMLGRGGWSIDYSSEETNDDVRALTCWNAMLAAAPKGPT